MNFAALSVYGIGHFGKSLLWMSSGLTFAFYLTEVAGLHPATMAWVLAFSLMVNAGSDWLVGKLLGRYIVTVGTAMRLQFIGSGIAGLCFVLFAQTSAIGPDIRTLYALAVLILFRLGYSLYDVPQNTLLGLLSGDDSCRSQIAAARYAAAGLATIAVTLCLSIWILQIDIGQRKSIFAVMATTFAIIAFGSSFLVKAYFSREAPHTSEILPRLRSSAAVGVRPLPPVLAFGSIMIFSSLMPVFTELKVYYAASAFPSDTSAIAFLLCSAIGQVLAQPVWAWVGRRGTLVSLYRFTAVAVIAAGGFFGLAGAASLHWILFAAFLFGAASSGLLMAIWSIMGNVASFDPDTSFARFGLFTSCSKLSQAASIMLIGQVLAISDYRDGKVSVMIAAMTASVVLTGVLCLAVSLAARQGSLVRSPV